MGGMRRISRPDDNYENTEGEPGGEEEDPENIPSNPFAIPAVPAIPGIPPIQYLRSGGYNPAGQPFVAGEVRPELYQGQDGRLQVLGRHGPQMYMSGQNGFVHPRLDARTSMQMEGTGHGTGFTGRSMHGFGGLNQFYANQLSDASAFRQGSQGLPYGAGNSTEEMASIIGAQGNILLPNGQQVPDNMYSRRLGGMTPSAAPSAGAPKFNDQQRKWAGAYGGTQKAPVTAPDQSIGGAAFGNTLSPPKAATGTPNFSRAALIEGAKKSGDFPKVRIDFTNSHRAAGTGMTMDPNGNIVPMRKTLLPGETISPYAENTLGPLAEDIRARRDFAKGEAPVTRTGAQGQPLPAGQKQTVGVATKVNPYGTASATFGAPQTGGGMMPDPISGKLVAMGPALREQRAVQDTKFLPDSAGAKQIKAQYSSAKPLNAAKGQYFRDKVRGKA